mmetsp:Transcript_24683/g.43506  ORF Transcript_24683/g.43506 Transcript_24683/m.43506 type:complete len:609 (+) Transcript_24683:644-2470(+)
MKVSLKPGEQVLPFTNFETVEQQEVFGTLKRTKDPDIASLLQWNPDNQPGASGKQSDKPRWMTESRDNYRGFFFTNDYQRFLRLKYDDSTTDFHPESVRVESRANVVGNEEDTHNLSPEAGKTEESAFRLTGDVTELPQANPEPKSRPQTAPHSKRTVTKKLPTTVKKPEPTPKNTKATLRKASAKRPELEELVRGPTEQINFEHPRPASSSPQRQADPTQKGRQDERIKKMKETTRWLPDSAFTTYFGRPAFCNYGRGNTNPTYGGLMYGSYMTSHNIGPHEGDNNPRYQQVYEAAELKAAKRKPKAPEPPRKCKEEDRLNPEQVEEHKARQPILPASRKFPSKEIIKPDLYDAKRFKSEHNTPDTSNLLEAKAAPALVQKSSKPPTDRVREVERIKELENPDVNLSRTVPRAAASISTPPQLKNFGSTAKQQPVLAGKGSQPSGRTVSITPAIPKVEEERRLETVYEEPNVEAEALLDNARIETEPRQEECQTCTDDVLRSPSKRFLSTAYQDMTGRLTKPEPLVYEPYRYCKGCQSGLLPERPELTVEDMLRPPRHLGELPVQELDPKIYRDVPPKWTQRIPAAGMLSYRGPSAYSVIFYDDQFD